MATALESFLVSLIHLGDIDGFESHPRRETKIFTMKKKLLFLLAVLAILASSCELRREPAKIAPATSPTVEMTAEGHGSPIITGTGDGASSVNFSYGPEGAELNGRPIKEGRDTLFIWGPGDTTWVRW